MVHDCFEYTHTDSIQAEEVSRKKTRRTYKVQKAIVGLSLDDLKKKKAQKPELRQVGLLVCLLHKCVVHMMYASVLGSDLLLQTMSEKSTITRLLK